MRSSTSSSEVRFVAAFAITFLVLVGSWELLLRRRSGETLDFAIARPDVAPLASQGERWVVFGNCLMMTGVSPRRLGEQLGDERERVIVNIAGHEQSPIAFFEYLRRSKQYPDVIVTNVSSWINGTNFEQETELVAKADPLHVVVVVAAGGGGAPTPTARDQTFQKDADLASSRFQQSAETTLSAALGHRVRAFGHRYHLFDYALFLGTLATTGDLDDALYQLNMQSWFTVTGSEGDGLGYAGIHVLYRDDWPTGVDRMAERSLKRMRLSRLLTERYWAMLEDEVRDFESHGTQVVLVRMPEHPKIREFNDRTYDLPGQLRRLEERTGAPVLDLSSLGPSDGVHLFDAVHPDADAAVVITRAIGAWLRARHVTIGAAAGRIR